MKDGSEEEPTMIGFPSPLYCLSDEQLGGKGREIRGGRNTWLILLLLYIYIQFLFSILLVTFLHLDNLRKFNLYNLRKFN